MSAEKSLKFQFILDETSFSRVKRAMDEMIAKAQVLAKTLQNVGGGMGGGGSVNGGLQPSPWLNQQQTKTQTTGGGAFKQMATEGAANLKTLTESVKVSTNKQIQDISRLTQALGTLNGAYTKVIGGVARQILPSALPNVPYPSGGGTAYHRIIGGTARQVLAPGHSGGSTMAGGPVLAGTGGMGPGGPGAPGAAGGPGGLFRQLGPGAVNGQGIAQWALGNSVGATVMRSVGLVGAGAMAAVNMGQGFNNQYLDTLAQRGSMVRPEWEKKARADVSSAVSEKAFARMNRDRQAEILKSVGGTEAEISAMAGALKRAAASGGSDMSGLSEEAMGTERYGRLQAAMSKFRESGDWYAGGGRGLQHIDDTRSARKTANRALGVGMSRDKDGNWRDTYTPLEAKLMEQGYSTGELSGFKFQAQNMGGRDFTKYAGTMMSASAAGYNVGGTLEAAGRSANNNKYARTLTEAALGGGIDTAAGLQLGQSLFGFDPRGNVTGMGALKAIQNGFSFGSGGAQDLNQVARIQLGVQSADKLAGGFDGYGRGMNLVSAIGSMPGGTTYAQDALAGRMSFKELAEVASGGSSARSDAYGITSKNAMDQLGGMTHGLFSRYVEQGGTDNVSKAMRAMRASGQSEQDFLAGLGTKAKKGDMGARGQLEALGVMASDMMGGDTEGGIGMIQALSGVKDLESTMLKKGKIPGAGLDEESREKAKAEAEQLREASKAALAVLQDQSTALKENKDYAKTLEAFGKLTTATDHVIERFEKLAGVTPDTSEAGKGSTTANMVKTATQSSGVRAGARTIPVVGPLIGNIMDAVK